MYCIFRALSTLPPSQKLHRCTTSRSFTTRILHFCSVFYTSPVIHTSPVYFTLPQWLMTADASSETTDRRAMYCTFRMLSTLPPILFHWRRLLRNTYQTHPILHFSYVEHTLSKTFQRHMPHGFILYCIFRTLSILSSILFHGKRLLRSTPTMHSILYFLYV